MHDSTFSQSMYKLRFRDESSDLGLLHWRPLNQLSSWASSTDTAILRALIMSYGWRPFVFSGSRAHCFADLKGAHDALSQLVAEASVIKKFSVSPHLSLPELFLKLATGEYEVDLEVEQEIYGSIEISDVFVSNHDLVMASVMDSRSEQVWYVVYTNQSDGHLFLSDNSGRFTWITESERASAWSTSDDAEALDMAKKVTRKEGYYAYPMRMPKPLEGV